MVRPGRRLRPGDVVRFADTDDFSAEIKEYCGEGARLAEFHYTGDFMERLETLGEMPIPPYLGRGAEAIDRLRYQTVYSREWGSAAAPTAGLHFTRELLQKAAENGVKTAAVTLHVGPGTFRPVKTEDIREHHMHAEFYEISVESAAAINAAKAAGGRIVCVGTTSARALESAACAGEDGFSLRAGKGGTDIFIYPGYAFKLVDSLITNFHLPKSTLLMLVSALYDREKILAAYDEAIAMGYRFFSYGDAMFITGKNGEGSRNRLRQKAVAR
jgi:S-adenosylmethionine:tRNA ribosyltransferase-isomerase